MMLKIINFFLYVEKNRYYMLSRRKLVKKKIKVFLLLQYRTVNEYPLLLKDITI